MCDEWMPIVKLPLTREQYHQLPRNSAYRYEFLDGQVFLTPKPRHYHALLDLKPMASPAHLGVDLRRVQDRDFAELVPPFAATFQTVQPYGCLDESTRREASRQALERTRTGGDGPWIKAASFLAHQDKNPVGAILVTLLPDGDPCDWDSYRWREPPPDDCVEQRLGRPHLTWIFVSPFLAGRGVGTALLSRAVKALLELGYTRLLTTFMIGNDSSMLWHWRQGFQLLAYPGSARQRQRRLRKKSEES